MTKKRLLTICLIIGAALGFRGILQWTRDLDNEYRGSRGTAPDGWKR